MLISTSPTFKMSVEGARLVIKIRNRLFMQNLVVFLRIRVECFYSVFFAVHRQDLSIDRRRLHEAGFHNGTERGDEQKSARQKTKRTHTQHVYR